MRPLLTRVIDAAGALAGAFVFAIFFVMLAATVMREGSVSFTNLFSSVNSASMSTPLEEASGWWPISLKMPHMQMEGWFQCW